MYCRSCGNELEGKAQICTKCGCRALSGKAFCQNCGSQTTENQELCVNCKTMLRSMSESNKRVNTDFSRLSTYYRELFTRILDSDESYKGEFNTFAFLFGPIWALTKGLWGAVLTEIGLIIVLSIALFPLATITAIAYWFIWGFRGNYMYYNKYAKISTFYFKQIQLGLKYNKGYNEMIH